MNRIMKKKSGGGMVLAVMWAGVLHGMYCPEMRQRAARRIPAKLLSTTRVAH